MTVKKEIVFVKIYCPEYSWELISSHSYGLEEIQLGTEQKTTKTCMKKMPE